jgi:hypothetical protein
MQKKEITRLVNSKDGTLRVNNICYLRRWTKDGIGRDVDGLTLEFDAINNVYFGAFENQIHSRIPSEIKEECRTLISKFLEEVIIRLIKEI